MLSANNLNSAITFSYDAASRITNTKQNGLEVKYTYDVANNKLTVITSESGGKAIFGEAAGDDGTGVHGQGEDRGVYGLGWGSTGRGVYGLATDPSGVNYGVYGETWSSNGYAGYFQGRVRVTGNLSKGGGSFKIDHPLDPENKYLQHSFV